MMRPSRESDFTMELFCALYLHVQEVPEQERREGFEIGNAERLFTSTTNRASSS